MKDNEEQEQSQERSPSGEVSPTKPLSRSAELEFAPEEPDSGPQDEKDGLGAEAAPGALGQVKAKVEVCKDESVGEFLRACPSPFLLWSWGVSVGPRPARMCCPAHDAGSGPSALGLFESWCPGAVSCSSRWVLRGSLLTKCTSP